MAKKIKYQAYEYEMSFGSVINKTDDNRVCSGGKSWCTVMAPDRRHARKWAIDDNASWIKIYGLKNFKLQLLRYDNKRSSWAFRQSNKQNSRSRIHPNSSFYLPK